MIGKERGYLPPKFLEYFIKYVELLPTCTSRIHPLFTATSRQSSDSFTYYVFANKLLLLCGKITSNTVCYKTPVERGESWQTHIVRGGGGGGISSTRQSINGLHFANHNNKMNIRVINFYSWFLPPHLLQYFTVETKTI